MKAGYYLLHHFIGAIFLIAKITFNREQLTWVIRRTSTSEPFILHDQLCKVMSHIFLYLNGCYLGQK